jgi:hypothetical protein
MSALGHPRARSIYSHSHCHPRAWDTYSHCHPRVRGALYRTCSSETGGVAPAAVSGDAGSRLGAVTLSLCAQAPARPIEVRR